MKKNKILKSKAAKNLLFATAYQIVTIIVGLIVPRLIIQTYGSETNGLVNSITQFLGYITLLDLGFGPVVKAAFYRPIQKKNKQQIANIITASTKFFRKIAYIFIVYIVLLCIIFNTAISTSLDWWSTASLIIVISISTFFEYFIGLSYSLFLDADKKNYIINIVRILTLILSTIFTVIAINLGFNIQTIKLLAGLIFVIRPLFYTWYVKNKYDLDLKNADKNFKIKDKSVALAQHISGIIHGKTDIVLISLFINQITVSVYSVYFLVINALQGLVQNVTNSLAGHFGQLIVSDNIKKLRKLFKIYEILFSSIVTIIFSTTFSTIVPFVQLYTEGITDANYIQPIFAAIITIAFYIHSLKAPYNSIVNAAGLFRENRKGSIIEAVLNIIISLILIFPLGIHGVAIGTLVSVLYRYVAITRITSKKILKRSNKETLGVATVSTITFIISVILCKIINLEIANYAHFIITGLLYVFISAFVSIICYGIFYRKIIQTFIKGKNK